MFTARIHRDAISRLDAEYYEPGALDVDALVRAGPYQSFGACIRTGYRVVYHGVDGIGDGESVPFLAPTDVSDVGEYQLENVAVLVPESYRSRYPKGVAVADELLVEVKGNTTKVTVVCPEHGGAMIVSGSLYKATVRDQCDPRFIAAYLTCTHGARLKRRVVSNISVSYIGKDDLYDLPVPTPTTDAQRYIGSKVRQAEALRERARELVTDVQIHFAGLHQYGIDRRLGSWRQSARVLDGERLDANFYAPPAVQLASALSEQGAVEAGTLADLIKVNGFDPNRPISYFEIGGVDVATGCAWPIVVPAGEVPSRAQRSVNHWDILVGTVRPERKNVGIVPPSARGQLVATSGVAVLRAETPALAAYLWGYLRSDAATEQLMRWNSGAAYPAIDDEVALRVLVPSAGPEEMIRLGSRWMRIPQFHGAARELVAAARLLVEALIERKVTEAGLIAASTDPEADRALLARLADDGLDGDGSPLFSDLDALFDLIATAEAGGAA